MTTLFVADAAGTTTMNQVMPNSIVFRGVRIFDQCAVLVPGVNPLGLQLSNHAQQIVGERSY